MKSIGTVRSALHIIEIRLKSLWPISVTDIRRQRGPFKICVQRLMRRWVRETMCNLAEAKERSIYLRGCF